MQLSQSDRDRILASMGRAITPLMMSVLVAESVRELPPDDMISSLDEPLLPSAVASVEDARVRSGRLFFREIINPLMSGGRLFNLSTSRATQIILFESCLWICRRLWKLNRWPERRVIDFSQGHAPGPDACGSRDRRDP